MGTNRIFLFAMGLVMAAIPASATISYTACTSGCSDTSGGYGTFQTEPGASGLSFSGVYGFVAAGLNASTGVYTDLGVGTGGTDTMFTNYTSGGSVDTLTHISDTYLNQGNYGDNTGFEIDLPANTYAFAMSDVGCSPTCGSLLFMIATVGLGTQSSHGTPYNMTINAGGPGQFFGIISSTQISSIFIASSYNTSNLAIESFEIGTESGGATPEPSTYLLIGSGFIGLYFLRKRPNAPR